MSLSLAVSSYPQCIHSSGFSVASGLLSSLLLAGIMAERRPLPGSPWGSWKTPVFTAHLVFSQGDAGHNSTPVRTHASVMMGFTETAWWKGSFIWWLRVTFLILAYIVVETSKKSTYYRSDRSAFVHTYGFPLDGKASGSVHQITWKCHWWYSLIETLCMDKWWAAQGCLWLCDKLKWK